MTDAKEDRELDDEWLWALRRASQALLSPWPKDQPFGSLSQVRANAVRAAARELINIARQDPAKATASRRRSSSVRSPVQDLSHMSPELEQRVGVTHRDLMHLLALDAVRGFGPQKFKLLHEAGVLPEQALHDPKGLPLPGKTGEQLSRALGQVSGADLTLAEERAARQIAVAGELGATILTYTHPDYPSNIFASTNPVPVLYARGDPKVLRRRQAVACVGSRQIRPPYVDLQDGFATHAAKTHVVVSGFAMGADTISHRAAFTAGGATLCVMPCGLDRPFPPENKDLYGEWLGQPQVVFLSEFPLGTGASAMTLRKRNKLIVAAAQGVLVGQSSAKGGAMNAYRFSLEQRKPVATFASDASEDTSGNVQISRTEKVPMETFPLHKDVQRWDAWLSQLS